eukprot:6176349-Pleurochrysis_carterae.AAC.2
MQTVAATRLLPYPAPKPVDCPRSLTDICLCRCFWRALAAGAPLPSARGELLDSALRAPLARFPFARPWAPRFARSPRRLSAECLSHGRLTKSPLLYMTAYPTAGSQSRRYSMCHTPTRTYFRTADGLAYCLPAYGTVLRMPQ